MNRPYIVSAIALGLFLAACDSGTVTVDENPEGETIVINTGMPQGDVVDQKNGKEVWLGVGAVMGVDGTPANGVAFGHAFENGTYMLTGQVNIAIAEEGTFYQAWLKDERTGEMIEAGRPQPSFGDVRHGLRHESDTDLRAFTTVIITLENDDGDPTAGRIVAKGTLKEQKRS